MLIDQRYRKLKLAACVGLAAVSWVFVTAAPAMAQVNKCTGADGKVTYSDRECPASKSATTNPAAPKRLTDSEQLACAYNWWLNKSVYEQTYGIGADRIIHNGTEIYSSVPEARAMAKSMQPKLENCVSAGISIPRHINDLASNLWNALQKICSPTAPQALNQAAPLIRFGTEKNIPVQKVKDFMSVEIPKLCQERGPAFSSVEAIRADYRAQQAKANAKPSAEQPAILQPPPNRPATPPVASDRAMKRVGDGPARACSYQ